MTSNKNYHIWFITDHLLRENAKFGRLRREKEREKGLIRAGVVKSIKREKSGGYVTEGINRKTFKATRSERNVTMK